MKTKAQRVADAENRVTEALWDFQGPQGCPAETISAAIKQLVVEILAPRTEEADAPKGAEL